MLHRFISVFAAVAALFLGAPIALAASGVISLRVDNARRSAVLVEFERLKRSPRPTFIVLHGGRELAPTRRMLGLDELAQSSGFVVVYPESVEGRWRSGSNTHPDDLAFLRRLIAKLVKDGVADRRRIYLIGVGAGGALALEFGCQDADLAAGVATIAAGPPPSSCKPSRPISLLMIDHAPEPHVPAQPRRTNSPAADERTLAPFAAAAGCAPTQTPAAARPTKPHHAVRERLPGCKVPVELLRVPNEEPTGRSSGRRRAAGRTAPLVTSATGRAIVAFFNGRG